MDGLLSVGKTVEIIIEGNAMERHRVEAGVPPGSSVSQILFAIYTSDITVAHDPGPGNGHSL
jgi:hypothetical protein